MVLYLAQNGQEGNVRRQKEQLKLDYLWWYDKNLPQQQTCQSALPNAGKF
jgi:hypothetical protein